MRRIVAFSVFALVVCGHIGAGQIAYANEPFRKPVPRYSREDALRQQYAVLRYLGNYVEASPQKTHIERLMEESGSAYRDEDFDRVQELFDQVREVMKNAPMKGGIPSPRGELNLPMARLVVSLHEGEQRTFDRDNVLIGFAVAVHTGHAESTRRFVTAMLESRITLKPYGDRVAAVFRLGDDQLGIERDMRENLLLNRWVNGKHVAPAVFSSNLFELRKDGTVTTTFQGATHRFVRTL